MADGGVFKNTTLYASLENNILHVPPPKPLPGKSKPIPFMIVADDAFQLKEYIQKPYKEKRIFNYRLSRARRIVENTFGILVNRFHVFMTPIPLAPENSLSMLLFTQSSPK